MSDLKPTQRFKQTDAPSIRSLEQRREFHDSDFIDNDVLAAGANYDTSANNVIPKRSFSVVLVMVIACLVLLLSIGQWVQWLLASWQQQWLNAALSSLLSLAVFTLLVTVAWREYRLWRRLAHNRQWQHRATRIAESVQFGEAQRLCADILAVLPESVQGEVAAQWRNTITAEHSDQEQLQLFDQLVLAPLDKQAKRVIWRASSETSLAVAISPFALADMLVVVWRASRMLREIAQCYGAPIGQLRSLAMLKRALAALFWAGSSELALDMASDLISTELTTKFSARAGQGLISGLLVARLGNLAVQQLRPLPSTTYTSVRASELSKAVLARFQAAAANKS